jgi:G3E family GTPase
MTPVTVLTGFLGSGKTTLLCRLLRQPHDARIALLINEIGIAGTEDLEVSESAFLELTQGCVCCVRAADLRGALEQIVARGDVDRIVVETTGIADPLALTFVLERPDLAHLVRLDAVVTVVDAENWERTRVPEWDAQVGAADLLVLSKLDLAPDTERLRALLAEINPAARVHEGEPSLELLLDVERRERPATSHAHHSGFEAVSVQSDTVHSLEAVEDLLETLPTAVYRAKGVVRTPAGWFAFHVVAGRVQVEPTDEPGHGESRAVFLGRALSDLGLRLAFLGTAARPSAR